MKKPKRSDDKYWTRTRDFDNISFIDDLDNYIYSLEAKIEALSINGASQQSEPLHAKVFKLANELAINGYGNEAVKMHQICNGM